ncbi:MAG: hypothetical protein CMJ76_00595 [Planctomycetaceae bacterium]|nr:hypothetical protein [Planctomycetaceae bacterium]|tara:strand:+ start:140 stop:322 length:183 start_codon:yes stop_codon:yes gene_type:complete
MTDEVHQNWIKIKEAMEAQERGLHTDFYKRACTCALRKVDPGIPGYDEYYNHFMTSLGIT